jgi:phosphoglycolate phosphatase-like HAD superfamily hydrolase
LSNKELSTIPLSKGLEAIILDFDGTILESNHIKAEAFRNLFKDYPEHGDAIVALHRARGGMSRFEKFRIIHRDIIQKPLDDIEMERLNQGFGRLVEEEIIACPFVPGAREFLEACSARYHLFIASGTPQDELQGLVKRRCMNPLFKGVYGAPRDKGQILKDILAENGWAPCQALFIGDAIDDYSGSVEARVPFIGRTGPDGANPFSQVKVKLLISDLAELHRQWTSLTGTSA